MPRKKSARTIAQEIERSYTDRKKQIEEAMKTLEPGTRIFLDHVKALFDLSKKYHEQRAERGLDPKDLGGFNKKEFKFTATIAVDGKTVVESEEDSAIRKKFDEEYST